MSTDIIAIIKEAAAMGAAEAIRRMQPQGDRISQRQACKEYGGAELEQVKSSRSVAAMVVRIETALFKQK